MSSVEPFSTEPSSTEPSSTEVQSTELRSTEPFSTEPSDRQSITPVVVIGGGIAGLVAALDLSRAGLRPVLLESGAVCGGVVSAHRVAGLTLDAGAESFATARPAVAELIAELGLTEKIVQPNPTGAWVRHRAGTAPLPANGFLGIPGRPWAADVRRVIGFPGAVRCALDVVLPTREGLTTAVSLGRVVRNRMGRRVLDRLVEPVAGGVYAADPDSLEVATVAPGLSAALVRAGSLAGAARSLRTGSERPGSAVAGLTGGLHILIQSLLTAIVTAGGEVHPSTAVTALTRESAGWRVEISDGETILADRIILAVPATAAARLLESAVPSVSAAILRAPITPVLICTLVLDDHRLDAAPRGTGVLVSSHATGVRAKALTHATAKWPWLAELAGPGRHVLRLSYGRGNGSDLPVESDLVDVALADAAELLGVALRPSNVVDHAVVRWPSALPAPRPGHAEAVQTLRADLDGENLTIVGAAVAGSGLAAVVGDARREAARLAVSHPPRR